MAFHSKEAFSPDYGIALAPNTDQVPAGGLRADVIAAMPGVDQLGLAYQIGAGLKEYGLTIQEKQTRAERNGRFFAQWAAEYHDSPRGKLPTEWLRRACTVDWDQARRVRRIRDWEAFFKPGAEWPADPIEQLLLLERMIGRDDVTLFAVSARECGFGTLADLGGLRDLYCLVAVGNELLNSKKNKGQLGKAVANARNVVAFRGGWGSHPTVWEDLLAETAHLGRRDDTIAIGFSTIPYGFSDFLLDPDIPRAWNIAQEAGVLTHQGIGFMNAAGEYLLGLRDKRRIYVHHSFMASEILHKPAHELRDPKAVYIAIAPAAIGRGVSIGNYDLLGWASKAGGSLPSSFDRPTTWFVERLIEQLGGEVDQRTNKTHDVVSALARLRGTMDKSMAAGISYLSGAQGPIRLRDERRKGELDWVYVIGGLFDPLVNPQVYGLVHLAGVPNDQVFRFGLGHYPQSQSEADSEFELAEFGAARGLLVSLIVSSLAR
jgi:hypothetical protein